MSRLQTEVEKLIDSATLLRVLDAISETAALKAQHLRENWQDDRSARVWEKAASRVDNLAFYMRKNGLHV